MNDLYDLPNGWDWKNISDVITDIKTGTTPPKKEQKYYDNPSIKWFAPSDFGEHKELVESKNKINPISIIEKKAKVYPSNSLLLVAIGATVGKIGIIRDESSSNQQITAMKFKDDIDVDYSYYWFLRMKQNIIDTASSATLPIINQNGIKSLPFPYTALSEQQRIVSKLDKLFEKIDKSISLHQKNMDEADVFMGSVLNDVFGELEEKYKIVKLSDIAQIKGGKRLPKGKKLIETETDYPYIRVADFLDNGTVNKDTIQYITEEIYQQIKNYTISSNDLYISIAGTIGKTGIISKDLDGANLTENAAKFVYKIDDISNKYIYFLTNSSKFSEQIGLATKTVAQPKLALSRLSEVNLPLPPLFIQQKVVEYLDEVSEKIEKVKSIQKEKMNSLKALKASILDKAFRGEL